MSTALRVAADPNHRDWRNEVRTRWAALRPLVLSLAAEADDGHEILRAEPVLIELLEIVQATLTPVEGARLSGEDRRDLGAAQRTALQLLEARGGRSYAKAVMRKAAGGRALTVCQGHGYVRFPFRTRAGATFASFPSGDGCGLVFEEPSPRAPFAIYCPACREVRKRGESAQARAAAFEAGLEDVAPGAWQGACSSCGREFVGDDVRRRRCDQCRRKRRVTR